MNATNEQDDWDAMFHKTTERISAESDMAVVGRIDQYEILKELGTGGFGSVFLARDTAERRLVAVKGLPREMQDSEEELERIRRNFEMIVQLKHDRIVALRHLHKANQIDFSNPAMSKKLNVEKGQTLLVMDYAEGLPLSRWVMQFADGKVPYDKAIEVSRQIASALDYAHQHKIIHRDIKPQNVIVQSRDDCSLVAQVLDFGLAAEVRSSLNRVSKEVRATSGTRQYMAPEQWLGKKQGRATDQYALAVLFFELVTGEVPFASAFDVGDTVVMMTAVTTQPPEIPSNLPIAMRKALKIALAKDPTKRFGKCCDFVEALSDRPFTRRIPLLAGVVTVALAISIAAGVFFLQRHQAEIARANEAARQAQLERQAEIARANEAARQAQLERQAEIARANEAARQAQLERQAEIARANEAARQAQLKRQADYEKLEAEKKRLAREKKLAEERERLERAERERTEAAERKLLAETHARADAEQKLRQRLETKHKAKAAAVHTNVVQEVRVEKGSEAQHARALAEQKRNEREAMMTRLAKGSEFDPPQPARAPGTIRNLALPNGGRMTFVWCPPGRFLMGSPDDEQLRSVGEIQHVVRLTKGFWIGQTEVTRDQWKSVMGSSTRFAVSSVWGGDGDYPTDNVSWRQCTDFCENLSQRFARRFRLPTEAEWEYACRAGTTTPFSFGSALNGDRARCAGATEPYGTTIPGENSYSGAARVMSYGQNPWGIYDMHGNVFEWCADFYDDYAAEDLTDPKGPATGVSRVVRGGCWNYTPKMCRSAFRSMKNPNGHDSSTGFRVCCDDLP